MTLTQPLFTCPRAFVVIAAALLAVAHDIKPASGQDWPMRSLTLVVPWAAGGGTDVMGRIMARRMSEILGQQVIVENVAGAGGMMGSTRAAKAAPDGYTFVFGSRSDAINMTLFKHPTYSLQNDLAPVVLVADQPTILVARKDLPVEGLSEFITYVQRNARTILGFRGHRRYRLRRLRHFQRHDRGQHPGNPVSGQRPRNARPDPPRVRLFLPDQRVGGAAASERSDQGHRSVHARTIAIAAECADRP